MLDFITGAGIDCTDTPRIDDRRPGLYSIHLNGAERSFTYWRDTSAARMMMHNAEVLWSKVAQADVIYLSGITLAILPPADCALLLENLRLRKSDIAIIVFDPNIRVRLWANKDEMRSVISKAAFLSDIVLPSFDDELSAFGDNNPEEAASRYHALGADHVVVKNGPADTVHLQAGVMTTYPVAPIDSVIDTTAAGDSFNGAYIASLLAGHTIRDAIVKAQSCAGQVIRHNGALMPFSNI